MFKSFLIPGLFGQSGSNQPVNILSGKFSQYTLVNPDQFDLLIWDSPTRPAIAPPPTPFSLPVWVAENGWLISPNNTSVLMVPSDGFRLLAGASLTVHPLRAQMIWALSLDQTVGGSSILSIEAEELAT